jgi:hypothetical protein
LWSNALAYSEVNLAPRDRLAELQQIGERIAGQGPTLMTDYEPYGVRHFLRKADAEGASELRRRTVPLRSGQPLQKLAFADIDEFQLEGLLVYRTLVLRRSPAASRPPSEFQLVSRRRFYEVWQRPAAPSRIVARLPLGGRFQAGSTPSCSRVLRLARTAGDTGRLTALERPKASLLELSRAARPPSWRSDPNNPASLYPQSAGTLEGSVTVPRAGRYWLWLGGSFRRRIDVLVDGRLVARERHELSHSGHFVPLAELELGRGAHELTLRYGEADLHPGSSGPPFPFGPLVLAADTIDTPLTEVPARHARALCGKRLDWVEALSP